MMQFLNNIIQNLWLVFSEHVLVLWFENTLIIYSAEENSQAIELWRLSLEGFSSTSFAET